MNEANDLLKAFVWLIPFIPMLAALIIAVGFISGKNRGEAGEKQTTLIANGAALLSLVIVLAIDLHALVIGVPGQIQVAQWFSSGDYQVNLSFYLDTFALVMMTLVAVIAVLMIRFSVNYMHREAGYQRFFMILSLFMGAMLLIVMAGNVVLTFTGWELAGVSSYLLIAYAKKIHYFDIDDDFLKSNWCQDFAIKWATEQIKIDFGKKANFEIPTWKEIFEVNYLDNIKVEGY